MGGIGIVKSCVQSDSYTQERLSELENRLRAMEGIFEECYTVFYADVELKPDMFYKGSGDIGDCWEVPLPEGTGPDDYIIKMTSCVDPDSRYDFHIYNYKRQDDVVLIADGDLKAGHHVYLYVLHSLKNKMILSREPHSIKSCIPTDKKRLQNLINTAIIDSGSVPPMKKKVGRPKGYKVQPRGIEGGSK
jgi:hypothetical protein